MSWFSDKIKHSCEAVWLDRLIADPLYPAIWAPRVYKTADSFTVVPLPRPEYEDLDTAEDREFYDALYSAQEQDEAHGKTDRADPDDRQPVL